VSQTVSYTRDGELAVVTIDNPPVNATSQAVRAGLLEAINRAVADDSRALVLCCAGRTFIAGADITEFGKPPLAPALPDVLDALEALPKPVIVAIHGTALGGGLEAAMAGHYRIADSRAKLGLPEVKLGLLPGAGGTRRAPRLMGVKPSLELMTGGAPISAEAARASGLVDRVTQDALLPAALAYARELLAAGATPRPTAAIVPVLDGIDTAWFAAEKTALRKSARGRTAPQRIVDALELGVTLPPAEAALRTREMFLELVSSTESKALRHLFFAEREAAKLPADCRDATRRTVERIGVLGGGTMGAGIAMNFAESGLHVTVIETDDAAAARALERIRSTWQAARAKGRLDDATLAKRLERVRVSTEFSLMADMDLVVEAIFENLQVKQEVFGRLDAVCRPGAILASNTSYQDLDAIAAATSRPADVIGMHYFSPANIMKLLEVVRGAKTAPDVVATVMDLARRVGKIPALVGVCYGFVGNRMLIPYGREAQMLLLEGATPSQVDGAMEEFGMAMGPCAVGDLAGLDVGFRARSSRSDRPDDPRWFRVGDMLAEQGRFGQKTGAGFYLYEAGGRERRPDPAVEQMIRDEAARLGVAQRAISATEIVERLMYAMVNEGCRALEEGIAQRASDIDLIYANGYGFPAVRGGPMMYAQTVGLGDVLARIRAFREQLGPRYWEPSALLVRCAASGESLP
jgi:3-hydroxyacyl-CoA dehydrogenase